VPPIFSNGKTKLTTLAGMFARVDADLAKMIEDAIQG
jgi:hypothetical protein